MRLIHARLVLRYTAVIDKSMIALHVLTVLTVLTVALAAVR